MNIVPVPVERLAELFALYDEYDRPRETHPDLAHSAEILGDIRKQKGEIFVALEEQALVGTYMIHICSNLTRCGRPFGVIENVICAAASRRTGIGRLLMTHAADHAQRLGCYKIFLQTGENRVENHAFYEACGFQRGKQAYQIRFAA